MSGYRSAGNQDNGPSQYDASASAFQLDNQGGYLPNSPSGRVDSPASNSPNSNRKGPRSGAYSQTLLPVTLKQLVTATQANPDDVWQLNGKDLNHVTFVAMVSNFQQLSTNVSFMADDSTEKVEVGIWLDHEDYNDYTTRMLPNYYDGMYVRVFGDWRSFHNKNHVIAYRVQPVVDFNELTYHLLEALHVYMQGSKGSLSLSNSGYQQSQAGYQQSDFGYQPAVQAPNRLEPMHNAILQCIRTSRSTEGCSVSFLCQQMRKTREELLPALSFLSNEGHLYTSVSDEHYQVTSYT